MEFIMAGGNIEQAFYDLYIPKAERTLVYTSSRDDFKIYEVTKNVVNTLFSVPNQRWDSRKWGWWCHSRKSFTMNGVYCAKINGALINVWANSELNQNFDSPEWNTFSSLKDYAERMWNKTSDHSFMNLLINLAELNNMTVTDLLRNCHE